MPARVIADEHMLARPFARRIARGLPGPRIRRLALVIVAAGGLSLVPLVGTLGYESSLVLAPIFAALGAAVGVDAVRSERASPSSDRGRLTLLANLGRRTAAELGWLLACALGLLLASQAWQRNCDPWAGLGFFALGPALSAALGAVAGAWGGVLATGRPGQLALAWAPIVASTLLALSRLYFDPVVFAYDPFWGWFSGAIYDEDVALHVRYLEFRAYNLMAASTAIMLLSECVDPATLRPARPRGDAGSRLLAITIATLAIASAAVASQADRLGFTATAASLERRLPLSRTTEHFVIHYVGGTVTAREIDLAAAEHEFAWVRLAALVGAEPSAPVHSFVFASPDHKREVMGAGAVEVAAPWRGHIYLNDEPWPHAVLHHELAHVFGSVAGDAIFGLSRDGFDMNLALIEGFATALAPRARDGLDLHDQAAILDRLERRPPLSEIMGPGFWTRASRHAYTATGSFCLWLLETSGIERLLVLYRTAGDFDATYGESLVALEGRWLEFLRGRSLREDDVAASAERFRVRPVFERPCAHRVAALFRQVRRAREREALDEVVEHYRTLCSIEPERTEYRIELARALAEDRRVDEAVAVLGEARERPDLTVSLRAGIDERLGDLALVGGELDAADRAYGAALALHPGESAERVLELKRMGAADERLAPILRDYFALLQAESDAQARAVIRLHAAMRIRELTGLAPLGDYLTARQLLNASHGAGALHHLRLGLAGELPSPAFVHAAQMALVNAATRTGASREAEAAIAAIEHAPTTRSGHRIELVEWRARIAFLSTRADGSRPLKDRE